MRFLLYLLQLPATLIVAYLDLLTMAATRRRHAPLETCSRARFAVLVPAHNEEVLLPRLLRSIGALDYPSDLYDVHVVADNCNDGTSAVARSCGAGVYERRDDELRGKGYALRWLLAQLRNSGQSYDAYVFLDADSVVSENFLHVMNRHLARGDQVIQSYYGVLNPGDSWTSALRFAALALYNGLRPRGRDALGLSAGIRGNGMAFTSDVLARFGWEAFTLAEDVEFHLKLVEAGVRVRYASEATVLGEMPVSLRQAHSQNVRWERGRLQMLRALGPRLLTAGLRRGSPMVLDALAEQLVPPLSILTGLTGLTFLATVISRFPGPRRLASLLLLGQIGYVLTGLRLAGAGGTTYLALLRAPIYILWKMLIYGRAVASMEESQWVRTSRSSENP